MTRYEYYLICFLQSLKKNQLKKARMYEQKIRHLSVEEAEQTHWSEKKEKK